MDFNIYPYGDYANTRYNWFEDVRVRQAMTMCTDRQGMVDNIMFGRSEVIHTYIPSVHPLYPEGLTEYAFDVEAANALLDEAGYDQRDADGFRLDPNGQRFAPRAGTTAGNVMREQIMQIFKENQAECGIDVQIYFVPSSEWFADGPEGELFGRRYDLGEFAWLTGVEPACNLYAGYNIPGPEGEVNPVTGLTYTRVGVARTRPATTTRTSMRSAAPLSRACPVRRSMKKPTRKRSASSARTCRSSRCSCA
jgi:peptide/nickel transport system substrate-binding protein